MIHCIFLLRYRKNVNCNCFPVNDVINFHINLSFLIKPFPCMTQKSGPKCNIQNETSFLDEIKSIFRHVQRTFIKANKAHFFEGEGPIMKHLFSKNFSKFSQDFSPLTPLGYLMTTFKKKYFYFIFSFSFHLF